MPTEPFHFVKALSRYLIDSVRPGLEWLVKLVLVHTASLQGTNAAERPSVSELRTFYKFVHSTVYPDSPRYSHYVAFNRDMGEGERNASVSIGRSASRAVGSVSFTRGSVSATSHDSSSYGLHDTCGGGRYNQTRMRWAYQVGDELLPDGFVVNTSSPRWSSLLAQVLEIAENRDIVKSGGVSAKDMRILTQSVSAAKVSYEAIYRDHPFPSLTTRNAAFKPVVRKGDSFELEWLQVLGVKVFSASGNRAETALGAEPSARTQALKAAARQRKQTRIAHIRSTMTGIKGGAVSVMGKRGGTGIGSMINTASSFNTGAQTRRATTNSPGQNTTFQSGSGRQNVVQLQPSLADLLTEDVSRRNFFLLGELKETKAVFLGMDRGITEKVPEFKLWKEKVVNLSRLDLPRLTHK